jgi:hypothetical protein
MNDDSFYPLSSRSNLSSVEAVKDPSLSTVSGSANNSIFSGLFNFLLPLIYLGLAFLIVFSLTRLILNYVRNKNIEKLKLKKWSNSTIMEISVPKETVEQVQKDQGNSAQKDSKDSLAIGEQVFDILSNFTVKNKFLPWLKGEYISFSFEIVNIDQEIRFWIVSDKKYSSIIEKQIIAIYSKAHIEYINETKFFKDKMVAHAEELDLDNIFELPIKTYKLIDNDPLNNITNALTNIRKEQSCAIQLIVEPVNNKNWQKKSQTYALKIQQGQNPKNILYPENDFLKKIFKEVWKAFKDIGKEVFKSIKGSEKKDDKSPFDQGKKDREIDLTGKKQQIQLTPQQQEIVKKLEEKSSKSGFKFTIRVIGTGINKEEAKRVVDNIIPSFKIYEIKPFNGFKKKKTDVNKTTEEFLLRSPNFKNKKILNTEELTSIWHLPSWQVQTANIKWLLGRRLPLPLKVPEASEKSVYIGQASSRGVTKDIFLKTEDRFRHIYSLGGSGSGKTVTMNMVALQDIYMGNGVCVVDPHGESIDDILRRIPPERIDDVIVFSPSFTDRPLALNMLETDPLKPTQRTLVVNTLFTIWDKLYDLKKSGGPMFENYMKNAIRLVMSHTESGSTLLEIPKVLVDDDYRAYKLGMCDDQEVIDFWEKQAVKAGGDASLENIVPYITAKLSPFLNNDFIRPMIGQQKSVINFREAMDNNKIVLVSLAKGQIGDEAAYLIGMVLVGGLLLAGMGRSDGLKYNLDGTTTPVTPSERPPFFIYIDEMQNFLFDAIPKGLEEIRKYKVGFYLAHQFIKQVVVDGSERIKDSIMANCGTKLIFRCGPDDAKYLETEFFPLSTSDIQNPEKNTFNAITLIDQQKSAPYNISAKYTNYDSENRVKNMFDYFEIEKDRSKMELAEKQRLDIINLVKQKYGRDREEVEKEIKERGKLFF